MSGTAVCNTKHRIFNEQMNKIIFTGVLLQKCIMGMADGVQMPDDKNTNYLKILLKPQYKKFYCLQLYPLNRDNQN